MKKGLVYSLSFLFLLTGILSLNSCKKPDDDLGPARQFATSGKISITAGQTSALLSWKEAINTDSTKSTYTVEVSQDSSFADGSPRFTYVVSGTSVTVMDTQLTIRTPYFARVKTNGATAAQDSHWVYSSHFSLTGEQIFFAVKDAETKFNSVILRWKDTTGATLTKIVLTPDGGSPTDYTLTQGDIDSGFKQITGLSPLTNYHAQIFSTTKEKGFTDFKTKDVPVYAYTINPTMDLAVVLDTCAPSIIIGLDTGTYMPSVTYSVKGKSVTLMSVSGNPADTKIVFKEFKIMGDGAGINLKDLSLTGDATALYFLNLAGLTSDAAAANFANISVVNCRVSNYGNCFMRADRGTAAGDHKIGSITLDNSIVFNNTLANQYTEFTLNKLGFQNLNITNTTFYNSGRALILMATTLPTTFAIPIVTFDHNTVNNFGVGSQKLILDASANPVKATFSNSIIANAPRSGTLSAPDLIRSTGTGTILNFNNNDYFKLTNGTGTALTLPTYAVQAGNLQIDLTWTATTVDFTLPAGSPVRTASNTGGPIGDPRWY